MAWLENSNTRNPTKEASDIQRADERFLLLASAEDIPIVYVTGTELNLNHLPNVTVHVFQHGGENTGILQLDVI
jgi:hypothetical protein